MGSEQVLKKSLLGGFKKEGVLNYIEQLQSEILTLKKEVNENSDCKNQLESILEERDNTDNGFAALKEENEQLKAVIEALNEEKAVLSTENEKLKNELECECKIFECDSSSPEKITSPFSSTTTRSVLLEVNVNF